MIKITIAVFSGRTLEFITDKEEVERVKENYRLGNPLYFTVTSDEAIVNTERVEYIIFTELENDS